MDFLGIVRELVLVHFACSGRFVCLFRACGLVRSGRGLGVGGEGANQRPPSFGWDLVSDSGVSRVFAYVSSLDDEGSGVWAFGLAGPLGEKRGARRGARMRGRSQLGRHGARVRARVCWEPHQEATFGRRSEVGPLPRNQRGGLPHAWPQESKGGGGRYSVAHAMCARLQFTHLPTTTSSSTNPKSKHCGKPGPRPSSTPNRLRVLIRSTTHGTPVKTEFSQ